MEFCVQKFGGSSLTTDNLRHLVAQRIIEKIESGCAPVVVVSAMGRAGDKYATDSLIDLIHSVSKNPDPQNLDLLLSCGEVISAVILAETLNRLGCRARAMTGWQAGIVTDQSFGNARIISVDPEAVIEASSEKCVPVIAGFQGQSPSGKITTLGRGGSDITAVAIAAALECRIVEIYTDVDGVKTADPRLIPDAPTIAALTYNEVMELAHLGAKVVHPRAVEIAMEARIELKVLGTDQTGFGTTIAPGPGGKKGGAKISDRVVTGIAHLPRRAHVKISGLADFNQSEVTLQVFDLLARNQISIDLIYLSPQLIAFIIDDDKVKVVEQVLAGLGLNVTVDQGYAKVSVVGAGMHGVPGVMARVVRSLEQANVPIFQTTDSHANISCLIREKDLLAAVRALFAEFELAKEGM
ncbi:MAG: aspartate kinase [Firmicutes bacterium]|nr:aspartate kinase [Bacillota bacterium]NLL88849.1 aspartate kinase [Bacillota bacterium]